MGNENEGDFILRLALSPVCNQRRISKVFCFWNRALKSFPGQGLTGRSSDRCHCFSHGSLGTTVLEPLSPHCHSPGGGGDYICYTLYFRASVTTELVILGAVTNIHLELLSREEN